MLAVIIKLQKRILDTEHGCSRDAICGGSVVLMTVVLMANMM